MFGDLDTISGSAGPGEPAPRPSPGAMPFPDWDRYELQRELGHGGMGTVYQARDRNAEDAGQRRRLAARDALSVDERAVAALEIGDLEAATVEGDPRVALGQPRILEGRVGGASSSTAPATSEMGATTGFPAVKTSASPGSGPAGSRPSPERDGSSVSEDGPAVSDTRR